MQGIYICTFEYGSDHLFDNNREGHMTKLVIPDSFVRLNAQVPVIFYVISCSITTYGHVNYSYISCDVSCTCQLAEIKAGSLGTMALLEGPILL